MRTKRLNNKGFTLVEVIVVAVIVAVLALVAIQLYTGYVAESRQNTAENLAASAASYLQTERNRGNVYPNTGVVEGGSLIPFASGTLPEPATFKVPNNSYLYITADDEVVAGVGASTGGVTATTNTAVSKVYPW